MLTIRHIMPFEKGVPRDSARMSRMIRLSSLNAGGGVRFGGVLDSSEFRWRVAVLVGDYQNWLFSLGATIVDLDKSGLKEKN